MSVYIKGMELPKSCESCPCRTADAFGGLGCQATGYIPLRKANQDRPEWCPIIPVPDHGDLIDRDALPENRMVFNGVKFINERIIKEASVVIPADKDRKG